jgi:hypothetical protein
MHPLWINEIVPGKRRMTADAALRPARQPVSSVQQGWKGGAAFHYLFKRIGFT